MASSPQPGIFNEDGCFFLALEYRCTASGAVKSALRKAYETVEAGTSCVFAFGPAFWRGLSVAPSQDNLRDFTAIEGPNGFTAPATQHDILIWAHGKRADAVFDAGRAIHKALEACAGLELEVPGFVYRDSRDLTGFIDGTANPKTDEARQAALIPLNESGASGSYVLSQRFIHDLAVFNKLSIPQQEGVIGRTKLDSIELEEAVKPKDAHIARAEIEENGVELKIYRRSFPYGGMREHGLYFLAFACDPHRFDAILKNMYGVSGDGLHDRLLHFTRAVSGSYWFAPSQQDLALALS